MARLRIVPRDATPPETAYGSWVDLPLAVRSKAAAIAAEASRLRSLDTMATHATVARARAALTTLRRLVDELAAEL